MGPSLSQHSLALGEVLVSPDVDELPQHAVVRGPRRREGRGILILGQV
jgi:hypothetical protein